MRSAKARRRYLRRGMSVVEVLISLAIAASLLTAAAAAYSASARAVEINDQFFRASQAARVAVNQIMTEVRRAQACAVDEEEVVLELTTAFGENRIYSYVPAERALTMTVIRTDPDSETVFTLARNIEALSFFTDGATVTMTITVAVENNSILLNGSALPRRSITYQ